VLIFTASEVETAILGMGISPAAAGLLGGMSGGIAQAYATMGMYLFISSSLLSWYSSHPRITYCIQGLQHA
jgi:hypothetical protein